MDMLKQQSCNSCEKNSGSSNKCDRENELFPRAMGRMNNMNTSCMRKESCGCRNNSDSMGRGINSPSNRSGCGCRNTFDNNCRGNNSSNRNDCGRRNTFDNNCRGNNSPSNRNDRDCRNTFDNNGRRNDCGCRNNFDNDDRCNNSPSRRSDSDCPKVKEACFTQRASVDKMQIGMAYVPWQEFENVWDGGKGLAHGTIFEDLSLPFLCDQCCKR